MTSNTGKRQDIQGLRALCVIAVVLFHLDFGFDSGYLGVDLFFIISGYVISSLLNEKLAGNKRKELFHFYQGRIFRLVPALGTVVFVTSILSFFLISPLGMQQNAAKTGIGASLFSSNFVIAKVTEDYFSLPAQSNPLLHTWSLGVEEQFYLVFPIVLFFIFGYFQKRVRFRWFVGFSLFLISLFVYLGVLGNNLTIGNIAIDGFYSPLSRAWQFLIGGFAFVIANYRKRRNFRSQKSLLLFISLLLIVVSLNLSEPTFRFPSPLVLLPALLLFYLLWGGESKFSIYGKLIRSRPMVWIGDRSYSIYLWHWPFIVFGSYLFPQKKPIQFVILFLGLALSVLAYNFIEHRFHQKQIRSVKSLRLVVSLFIIFPLVVSGALGFISSQVLFPRYESGQIQGNFNGDVGAVNFERFTALNQSVCSNADKSEKFDFLTCPIDVLIIGDSHAEHLVPGFRKNYPELITASKTNSIFSENYSNLNQSELGEIAFHPTLKIVIINSFWAKNGIPEGLEEAVNILLLNGKSVLLLDDVPDFPFDAFSCKYGLSTFIKVSRCSLSSSFFFERQKDYMPDLKSLISLGPNLELVSTSKYFCDLITCNMLIDNMLMYLDLNHLNTNGSVFISKKIVEDSRLFCRIFPDRLPKECKL